MLRTVLLTGVTVVLVVGANWLGWRAVQAAPAPATGGDAAWEDFRGVTTRGDSNTFPPALQARDGTLVTLTGVVFTMPQLTRDGRLMAAVLAPPAKFACCGLSCETGGAVLCIVPRDPPPDPGRRRLARVSGRLHLQPEAGGLTAMDLQNADITWLPDP
jgi:hypothetical protein